MVKPEVFPLMQSYPLSRDPSTVSLDSLEDEQEGSAHGVVVKITDFYSNRGPSSGLALTLWIE